MSIASGISTGFAGFLPPQFVTDWLWIAVNQWFSDVSGQWSVFCDQ
jgi:hypothetical protein